MPTPTNVQFYRADEVISSAGNRIYTKLYVRIDEDDAYTEYLQNKNLTKDWIDKSRIVRGCFDDMAGEQPAEEISYAEALATELTDQKNWIEAYLKRQGEKITWSEE